MKKVISLIIICLFLLSTIAYATNSSDILMQLDQTTSSSPITSEDVTQTSSDVLSTLHSTINHDDYVTPEEPEETLDEEDNETEEIKTTSNTQKVTKTGTTDENFQLTTSDIINIIVISVGVVLIFLGIAILIKNR